jgi:hypothetical protein
VRCGLGSYKKHLSGIETNLYECYLPLPENGGTEAYFFDIWDLLIYKTLHME